MNAIEALIDFKLPKGALFGKENYAGDAAIKEFMAFLKRRFELDFETYVTWQCLPDVTLLKPEVGSSIILRSERIDTLLIEFVKLFSELQYSIPRPLHDLYATASILRWQAEFFVGLRHPHAALTALKKRNALEGLPKSQIIPFRDECLASVPEAIRFAVQAYSLAHEVGHIVWPADRSASLFDPVDGISPYAHLERDFTEVDFSNHIGISTVTEAANRIDAYSIMSEINADFFAFESVWQFVHRLHECDMETAIRISLAAAQAQLFIDSTKGFSKEITRCLDHSADLIEAIVADDMLRAQYSIRARSLMRRAGISWAKVENRDKEFDPELVSSSYVPRIDSMIAGGIEAQKTILTAAGECGIGVFQEVLGSDGYKFESDLTEFFASADARIDLYNLLIAFGCAGGVCSEKFLRALND